MQHKWHKEIKAWADGAEIEVKWFEDIGSDRWHKAENPSWNCIDSEYRIKPEPKEPQYLYVWQPYDEENEVVVDTQEPEGVLDDGVYKYIGKIKLEVDDE
jgi:hypothetical protein